MTSCGFKDIKMKMSQAIEVALDLLIHGQNDGIKLNTYSITSGNSLNLNAVLLMELLDCS